MTTLPIEPDLFWTLLGAGALLYACLFVFIALPEEYRPLSPLLQLQQKLRLEMLNPAVFLIGLIFWGSLFSLLFVGLTGLIWEIFTTEWLAEAEDRLDWRFTVTKLAALTAVLGAVVAFPVTLLRLGFTSLQTTNQEQSLVTDRINKAVAGLGTDKIVKKQRTDQKGNLTYEKGSDEKLDYSRPVMIEVSEPNLEVRIGSIFALERIAQDSPRDHIQLMEILCAYIRENAPAIAKEIKPDNKLRLDIQTALTVIGRRTEAQISLERAAKNPREKYGYILDLSNSCLDGAELRLLDFSFANFSRAQLRHANLSGSKLCNTSLRDCDLSNAKLQNADLRGAAVWGCDLPGADSIADVLVRGAGFHNTNLPGNYIISAPRSYFLDSSVAEKSLGTTLYGIAMQKGVSSEEFRDEFLKELEIPKFSFGEDTAANWRAFQKSIGFDPEDPSTWDGPSD